MFIRLFFLRTIAPKVADSYPRTPAFAPIPPWFFRHKIFAKNFSLTIVTLFPEQFCFAKMRLKVIFCSD
jgi:hypothetical protein